MPIVTYFCKTLYILFVDFDIIISTKSRHNALRLSLPLMLNQARLPAALMIVDASDDHQATKRIVWDAAANLKKAVRLRAIESAPGLCYQRNIGLSRVRSPVVFFPDDDALWFPGYSEAIMKIYERDGDSVIGAVGGTESPVPPEGMLPGVRAPTDGLSVKIPGRIEKGLNLFEKWFFPDPFFLEARLLYRGRAVPEWLAEADASLVPTITGFRMSFWADLIKRTGFDEALARYVLFEDHDACMGILATHSIVAARQAPVFHHRPIEKRADDFEMGIMHVLNRAYIVAKRSQEDFQLDSVLRRHSWYKMFRYLPRLYDASMRARFRGAWHANRCVPEICKTPKEELTRRYLSLRHQCLQYR